MHIRQPRSLNRLLSTLFAALAAACAWHAAATAAEPANTELRSPNAGASALEQVTALDGRVSMLIPAGFKPLSEELLLRKYPNPNRPNLVWSNEATTVNVALEHTVHRVTPSELGMAMQQLVAGLKSAYPSADWFSTRLRRINGRDFLMIDVRTPAIDTEVRNLMVATSVDDRLLIVSFNTTRALEPEWMPIGQQIIESIRVR